MKSLREYAMNISEQAYHEYPAWSHSKIAKYARGGFQAISTLDSKIEPTAEMRFGSLLDTMLTRGKAETIKRYAVTDFVPSPAKKAVIDYILTKTDVPFPNIPDDIYVEAFDACEYQSKQKFETKVSGLQECYEYYTTRVSGKDVVSTEDWGDAMEMMKNIKTDGYLSTIFSTDHGNKEYLYQIQFVTDMDVKGTALPVKCMFDLLIVDHNDKTLQPVDLKTSSMPAYDFADQFVRMRYDIEANVYTDILKNVIKDTEYSDYTIKPYLFTDISRTDKIPVTFFYDTNTYNALAFKDYEYKDWKTLLTEIVEYRESQATVPSYIRIDGPNDLLGILNNSK